MKTLLAFLTFFGLACYAFGSRDRVTKIAQAELRFDAGDIVIFAQDRVQLKSLALKSDGSVGTVPDGELAGITAPKIESMEVLFGTFKSGALSGVKYRCVRFHFGAESEKRYGELPYVAFFFYDGKYHHREITRKIADGAWKVDGFTDGPRAIPAAK